MKEIAILTFHDSDNYGSVLQSYATCKMLNSSGFDCEILDLRKKEVERLYRIFKPLNSKNNIANNIYSLLHCFELVSRKRKFEAFRKNHLRLSSVRFANGSEIADYKPRYDGYVVGSDQVWNTDIVDFDPAYLLPFAGSATKAAYAASLGPRKKDASGLMCFKPFLDDFRMITVRENAAAETLSEILPAKPEVVLDPVFFLSPDEWKGLSSGRVVTEDYMFCYFAGGVTPEFNSFTERFAKEHHLKRVLLIPEWKNLFRTGRRCYNTGPEEFLSLIEHASVVCTNSFHCVAFSVLFNKDFIAGTNAPGCDDRINTLLKAAGLEKCEYSGDSFAHTAPLFDKANAYIAQRAAECRELLINTLR